MSMKLKVFHLKQKALSRVADGHIVLYFTFKLKENLQIKKSWREVDVQ